MLVGEEQPVRLADRVAMWRGDRRIAAAVCACIALAAAVAWWQAGRGSTPAASVPPPTTTLARTRESTRASDKLIVDVVGAVARPGIVRVAAGARVVDVIDAAGGAKPNADTQQLNLAAPVADGARIAVPVIGQAPPPEVGATPPPAGSTPTGTSTGPVNLNTATAEQLEALPGIGPATAQAIVSDREAHGSFGSVDDLDRVRGIGAAKLAQLRDLVTV
jgi:competence protein ComEA